MSENNSNNNSKNTPEARAALDQFKYEVANEIGVPLKKGQQKKQMSENNNQ